MRLVGVKRLLIILILLVGCSSGDQRLTNNAMITSTTSTTSSTSTVDHVSAASMKRVYPTTVPPTTTTTEAVYQAATVTPTGDVWWDLFGCETGYTYNPRIVSKTGKYRGAFQFDLVTWAEVGETGDPIDYSYEHQLAAAKRLQAYAGWGRWPHCSKVLGLR